MNILYETFMSRKQFQQVLNTTEVWDVNFCLFKADVVLDIFQKAERQHDSHADFVGISKHCTHKKKTAELFHGNIVHENEFQLGLISLKLS